MGFQNHATTPFYGWPHQQGKTYLLLKVMPYSLLKVSIISDVLHLTWNKALLLPADYRVQPSHFCAWGQTNLHAKLKKQFETDADLAGVLCGSHYHSMEAFYLWNIPFLTNITEKNTIMEKKNWKASWFPRVNLDRVTQPLKQS